MDRIVTLAGALYLGGFAVVLFVVLGVLSGITSNRRGRLANSSAVFGMWALPWRTSDTTTNAYFQNVTRIMRERDRDIEQLRALGIGVPRTVVLQQEVSETNASEDAR